jgi:NTE family protein
VPRGPLTLPDALVLGGGGTLGEAWMRGLLAGAEAEAGGGLDFRDCGTWVGTSAGSIVAATLAAGRAPDASERGPAEPVMPSAANGRSPLSRATRTVLRSSAPAAALVAPSVLGGTARAGAAARALVLGRGPEGRQSLGRLGRFVDRLAPRWDGRLRVVAVDRDTGRRVVFGAPGAPAASPGDAVRASCAVPWVFQPVRIGDRTYVDGGAWSATNLDVVDARPGLDVLVLNPLASLSPRSAAGAMRAAVRSSAAVEALAVRRRGARVRIVAPDAASAAAMGANPMDGGRARAVLGAAYEQGRALAAGR